MTLNEILIFALYFSVIWFVLGYFSLLLFFYTMKITLEYEYKKKIKYSDVLKTFISRYEMLEENKTARPEVVCLLFVGTGPVSLLTNIRAYVQLRKSIKNDNNNN